MNYEELVLPKKNKKKKRFLFMWPLKNIDLNKKHKDLKMT